MLHRLVRITLPGALVSALALAALAGCASKPAQSVKLLEPANGAVLTSPFKVRFGVEGLAVAPAGAIVAASGHHHLLIDVGPVAAGTVIPATPQHRHYGAAQTEAEITLPPGTYKLTAQFANGMHESYGPALSHTITVTVR